MNPCTCIPATPTNLAEFILKRHRCPVHGKPRQHEGPPFDFRQYDRREEPDPWPDLESRPDEGVFEGMSRHGLCRVAEMQVGESMRVNGHEVWRWEESSPITQMLTDGRPEGRVVIPNEWAVHQDLGGEDSPLRAAVLRWKGSGRTWYREEVPGIWSIVIAWTTGQHDGQALTHYAGEPVG